MLKKFLFTLIPLAVLLACLEIGLRMFFPTSFVYFPKMYTSDDFLGYRLLPGFRGRFVTREFNTRISVDRNGFRRGEEAVPAIATRRIVFLGDSYVMGYGVEDRETVSSLTARRLNALDSTQVYETSNLGVWGYGTLREMANFGFYGRRLRPDMLVLGYFYNDPGDNRRITARYGIVKKFGPNSALDELIQRSYLAGLVQYKLTGGVPSQPDSIFIRWDCERDPLYLFHRVQTPENLVLEANEVRLLARLKATCEGLGCRLCVFYIPHPLEIRTDKMEYLKKLNPAAERYLSLDPAEVDLDRPRDYMRQACQSLGISFLDLKPAFLASSVRDSLYFKVDGHWRPRGHALAAEVLAAHILDEFHSTPAPIPADSARTDSVLAGTLQDLARFPFVYTEDFQHAFYHMSTGDYTSALPWMKKVVEGAPFFADGYFQLGVIYRMLDSLEASGRADSTALYWNPARGAALYNLGRLRLRQKRWEEALRCFESLSQVEPENRLARFWEAFLCCCIGRFGLAQEKLRTLVAESPDFGDAAVLLGALEQRRSDPQQTREFFQLYGGAVVCFMNGEMDTALKNSQVLYGQGFEESNLLRLIAADCIRRGDYRQAEALLKRGISLNPYDYDLHSRLGGLYYSFLNDRGKALEHLRRSLELDPLQENEQLIRGIIDKLG